MKGVLVTRKIIYSVIALAGFSVVSCASGKVESPEPLEEPESEPVITHDSIYYDYYQENGNGIPLLVLSTLDGNKINSKFDWKDGKLDVVDGINSDLIFESIKLKGRGNSTWSAWQGFPKKGYSLKLKKKESVLGMADAKSWALVANYSDKSLLRNRYASYLGQTVFSGMDWNPSCKSVDLILNGAFWGNYTLSEKIKIDKKKVNIQNFAKTSKGHGKDVNGDGVVDINDGGFILETDYREPDEIRWLTKRKVYFNIKDPDPEDFEQWSQVQVKYVRDIIQKAEDAIYNVKDWRDYIDVDSFVDWYLANEFMRNTDSVMWMTSAYMYYNPIDKKLYMGPDWDFDIAMGNYGEQNFDKYNIWSRRSKTSWYNKLMKIPEFKQALISRWKEISPDIEKTFEIIPEMEMEIAQSAEKNFEVWKILGKYVWPNPVGVSKRTTHHSEVEWLQDWLRKRLDWMNQNIETIK